MRNISVFMTASDILRCPRPAGTESMISNIHSAYEIATDVSQGLTEELQVSIGTMIIDVIIPRAALLTELGLPLPGRSESSGGGMLHTPWNVAHPLKYCTPPYLPLAVRHSMTPLHPVVHFSCNLATFIWVYPHWWGNAQCSGFPISHRHCRAAILTSLWTNCFTSFHLLYRQDLDKNIDFCD